MVFDSFKVDDLLVDFFKGKQRIKDINVYEYSIYDIIIKRILTTKNDVKHCELPDELKELDLPNDFKQSIRYLTHPKDKYTKTNLEKENLELINELNELEKIDSNFTHPFKVVIDERIRLNNILLDNCNS